MNARTPLKWVGIESPVDGVLVGLVLMLLYSYLLMPVLVLLQFAGMIR